jgi:hypothetical protein
MEIDDVGGQGSPGATTVFAPRVQGGLKRYPPQGDFLMEWRFDSDHTKVMLTLHIVVVCVKTDSGSAYTNVTLSGTSWYPSVGPGPHVYVTLLGAGDTELLSSFDCHNISCGCRNQVNESRQFHHESIFDLIIGARVSGSRYTAQYQC